MNRRFVVIGSFVFLMVLGVGTVEAGGLLSKWRAKRACRTSTKCCQPATLCCPTVVTSVCAVTPSFGPQLLTEPCFGQELPDQASCQAKWNEDKKCCDDRHPGDDNKETRALCKIAAYVRYLYCEGEIDAPTGERVIDCEEPNFGCEDNIGCYYRRYPCCIYQIGCDN
jgi:hypothetical protein